MRWKYDFMYEFQLVSGAAPAGSFISAAGAPCPIFPEGSLGAIRFGAPSAQQSRTSVMVIQLGK